VFRQPAWRRRKIRLVHAREDEWRVPTFAELDALACTGRHLHTPQQAAIDDQGCRRSSADESEVRSPLCVRRQRQAVGAGRLQSDPDQELLHVAHPGRHFDVELERRAAAFQQRIVDALSLAADRVRPFRDLGARHGCGVGGMLTRRCIDDRGRSRRRPSPKHDP
jgi:hypothetical protein